MQKILALDTSSPTGSIALIDGTTLTADRVLNVRATHSERLLEGVAELLDAVGWSLPEVDAFAVTVGPGSFTGLRVGMASVVGMAHPLEKPVIPLSTLEVLACGFSFARLPVATLIDARKQEVYAALFDCSGMVPVRLAADQVIPPAAFCTQIPAEALLAGDGLLAYPSLFEKSGWTRADGALNQVRVSCAIPLIRQRIDAGLAVSASRMVPVYLRPSEAEVHLMAKEQAAAQGK